jgi:ribonuclease VapC
VAIALQEPGFEALLDKLQNAPAVGIGAPTLTEAGIVLSARRRQDARALLARFIAEGGVHTIPFTEAHFGTAVEAWLRFGKGRHQAALNFGDCMAYATARVADEPLLCTGEGLPKTHLELA